MLELARLGIEARGFDHDVMLYAFLLDADVSGCGLEEQARRRMDLKLGAAPEQHADLTLELFQQLSPAIDGRGLRKLYDDIELPLTRVLARMERTGIRIDGVELKRLSGLMETEISRLTAEIHELAGRPFNISSPQQLGRVLFEELNLPGPEGEQGEGDLHRRRRTRRTGRRSRNRAQGARVPPAHQAQRHLRGRAARADRARHRPPAHQFQPGRRGHRPALLVQSESAEHSDPHRTGARDPRRLRAPPGMEAPGGRLFADRAAPAGPHVGRRVARRGVPQRRGHPHAHRGGGDGRAAADGDAGSAARCQGREFRHRLRHQRVRPGHAIGHLAHRSREVHQELFRALRGGAAVHRRRPSRRCGAPA